MTGTRYPALCSPIKLASLDVKNRFVMAPMGTRLPTSAGFVTDDVVSYYAARARGGVGLVIFQYTAVAADGAYSPRTTMLYDDRFIPGLRRVVETVHRAGAKIAIELAHVGGDGQYAVTGARPRGPSAIGRIGGETPAELTADEIWSLVEAFGRSARRAREAGFDAVELHGCHGYLIHQFLTPLRNRRQDEWGGDAQRRARFAVEVARRMRELTGSDYPLLARLVVDEFTPGGITVEDGQLAARLLVEAGVDALDVTGGAQETAYMSTPPAPLPSGVLAPLGAAVKQAVGVPIILVGRLDDPAVAERILTSGQADLIALGRQLLADSDFPRKVQEGRADEVRPCLACTAPQCHGRVWNNYPVGCAVNPVLGREADFPDEPVARSRQVVVVGGGPAGMEAARTAARRGHRVTLLEASDSLGGQLRIGCVPPYKEPIRRLVDYYVRQLDLAEVEVRLGALATPESLAQLAPDIVVVATGGQPLFPHIPGVPEHVVSAWDLLAGRATVGQRVAVIGGGDVGCEVAEHLASAGKAVTVVEMLADIAPGLSAAARALMLKRFQEYPVDYITRAKVTAVEAADDQVTLVLDRGSVAYRLRSLDAVVLAVGTRPNGDLVEQLAGAPYEVRAIGDCFRAGTIFEAVRAGFEAGYEV